MGSRLPHCSVDNISYGVWLMKWLLRYLLKRHPEIGEEFYLQDHTEVVNAPYFMVITDDKYYYKCPLETKQIRFKDGYIVLQSRTGNINCSVKVNGHFVDIEGLSQKVIYERPDYLVAGDTLDIEQEFYIKEF